MKKHIQRRLRTLTWAKVGKIDRCGNLSREVQDNLGNNKRDFRADVLSLLSSALRPRLLGTVGIVFLFSCLFVELCLTAPIASATSSMTLTIPSNPISLNINPNINNGFAIGSDSVKLDVENVKGYTLSIKSKDEANGNALINPLLPSSRLLSISNSMDEDTYKNSDQYNTWGFRPSMLNGLENNAFLPGPEATEETIIDQTDSRVTDKQATFDIALGAKADYTLSPGTYSNTFIISASTNATPASIEEPYECQELTDVGDPGIYTDPRDKSDYIIARLADGKCWFAQNLRITNQTIKSSNSDLNNSEEFTIPASDISKYNSNDYNNDFVYYDGDVNHGAFYSWHTATAGSGTKDIKMGEASDSICPKGWRLPTKDEYQALYNNYLDTGLTQEPIPNFATIGYIYSTSAKLSEGSTSYYWSSTASYESSAYSLSVSPSNANPTSSMSKYYGLSVRCIAEGISPLHRRVTFKTGDNIEMIVIRDNDSGATWKATSGNDAIVEDFVNAELGVTVIPKANHQLKSWSRDTNLGEFKNSDLLSTTYTIKGNETLTAEGQEGDYTYIHKFSADNCSEDGNNVTDQRDGSTYTVAKLKDGKCWMTQNLRLVDKTVNFIQTNINSGSFQIPASDASTYSSSNYEGDTVYYDGDPNQGAYYTYHVATAGAANNKFLFGDLSTSICPKGWHLPTEAEYKTLVENYNTAGQLMNSPTPRFTAKGYLNSTNPTLVDGNTSMYWSATSNYSSSYTYARALRLAANSIDVSYDYNYRYDGGSIRCIAGETNSPNKFKVNYNLNGGSMSYNNPQTGQTSENYVELQYASRNLYEFMGWCSVSSDGSSCSGQLYSSNEKVPLSNLNGESEINVWAVWKAYPALSSFRCSSYPADYYSYAVVKDGMEIWVYKSNATGKCWAELGTWGSKNGYYRAYNWTSDSSYPNQYFSEAQRLCTANGWRLPSSSEWLTEYNSYGNIRLIWNWTSDGKFASSNSIYDYGTADYNFSGGWCITN